MNAIKHNQNRSNIKKRFLTPDKSAKAIIKKKVKNKIILNPDINKAHQKIYANNKETKNQKNKDRTPSPLRNRSRIKDEYTYLDLTSVYTNNFNIKQICQNNINNEKEKITNLQNRLKYFQEQNDINSNKIRNLEKTIKEKDEKIKALEKENKELKEEKDNFNCIINYYNTNFNQRDEIISNYENKINKKEEEILELNNEIKHINEKYKEEIEKLKSEIKNAQNLVDTKQNENLKLQNKYNNVMNEKKLLVDKMMLMQEENELFIEKIKNKNIYSKKI